MVKAILVLKNGTEIKAGSSQLNAIQRVSIEESCNNGEDLNFGSVCASKIRVDIITPQNKLPIMAGEKIILHEEQDGVRRKKGVFNAEKPQRKTANTTTVIAYDNISLLDIDVAEWYNSLDGFPYSAFEIAKMVCEHCGLNLFNKSLRNGDFSINESKFESVTARQIIQWVGEICGYFCIANEDGDLLFRWYEKNEKEIGIKQGSGASIYLQGSLTYEDYEVKKIDRVQIRQSEGDVGVSYPNDVEGGNTYIIQSNPFIMSSTKSEDIEGVAFNLYTVLKDINYTPCRVSVSASFDFNTGDIVKITDANGVEISAYIMQKSREGQKETINSKGNFERNGATQLYSTSFSNSYGKRLEIQKDINGLKITNELAEKALVEIGETVDDQSAQISALTRWQGSASKTIAETSTKATANEASIKTLNEWKGSASKTIATTEQKATDNEANITALAKRATDAEVLIAQIDQDVDNERARIDVLAEFQTETEKNIAEIDLEASENAAKIGLVVGTNDEGGDYVKGGIIAEAINGQTGVKIRADKLDIDVAKEINAKADEINIESDIMKIKSSGFSLENGAINAKKGYIGGWHIGYDADFKERVLRSGYCVYGTVSWGDGTYNTVRGFIFTVLRSIGLVYVIKKYSDYDTSETLAKIPHFKSPSFSDLMYDEDGDGIFEGEPRPI